MHISWRKTVAGLGLASALSVSSGIISAEAQQQETTVYVGGTLDLNSGKATGTAGVTNTQTRGNTTTTVDVNVNTRGQVNGTASQTTRR